MKNKQLIIILIVLVAVVAFIFISDSKKGERTLRSELVMIDSSRVSEILMYSKANNFKEARIYKENGLWKTAIKSGKIVTIEDATVGNMLQYLMDAKPKRLAAKSKDKWAELQVDDTSATRVKVKEDKKTTLDIMIGKFSFNQQARTMATYVRLTGEDEVYVVDGFIASSFNQEVDNFRNKKIIKSESETWTRLTFNSDSGSFILLKQKDQWQIDGMPADSTETVSYLGSISNIFGQEFADEFEPAGRQPNHSVKIETNAGAQITISAFTIDSLTTYIRSSENDACFDASKGDIFNRVFTGKSKFLAKI